MSGVSNRRAALDPNTRFPEAISFFFQRRELHLKPRSIENYRCHFRHLLQFFGREIRLDGFHEGNIRDYQRWRIRSGENPRGVGSSCINHEVSALSQVLTLANLWKPIAGFYEALPNPRWTPPKVLKHEEEERFFRIAATQPRWKTACHASMITANTTVTGCELRGLRLKDIGLEERIPQVHVVEITKNQNRVRAVPLNQVAAMAFKALIQLAETHGANQPDHFLFPYRLRSGKHDPTRPASPTFIRNAFRSIARKAGLPWLTPKSFRHQAMTKLLESGAPDETVRAIAGHASRRAMEYYSHIRMEAKSAALEKLVEETPKRSSRSIPRRRPKSRLQELREMARRLGIPADAAIELVLEYSHSQNA
jgi:integrase